MAKRALSLGDLFQMERETSQPLTGSEQSSRLTHDDEMWFASDDEKWFGDAEVYIPSDLGSQSGESKQTRAPPLKNTFIHFDIPRSPLTSSAPGVFVRRLFRTSKRDSSTTVTSADDHTSTTAMRNDAVARAESAESLESASTAVSVKNTFIHLEPEDDQPSVNPRSVSGPGKLQLGELYHLEALQEQITRRDSDASTSAPTEDEGQTPIPLERFGLDEQSEIDLHKTGNCTPCNYFHYKVDGCRMGSSCPFCHLCPKGEVKKRRKDKLRDLRKAGLLRRK